MKRKWAASLILVCLLLPAAACTGREEPAGAVPSNTEGDAARLSAGWMGRYARRDPVLAKLLTEQEGWIRYRDMDLFEAIRFFSMAPDDPGRIGVARSNLEMARTFDILDNFFLEIEARYLSALGSEAKPAQRGRYGLVLLRRGELKAARDVFFADIPKGQDLVWELGRVGVLLAEHQDVSERLGKLYASATKHDRALVRVATYLWGRPINPGECGYYGQALTAIEGGDLFSGLVALQMLEFAEPSEEAGADLFINLLFRQVFARLAMEAVPNASGPELTYLRGQALLMVSNPKQAAEAFDKVVGGAPGPEADAARLFGPEFDGREAVEIASVLRGYAFHRAGSKAEAERAWKEALDGGLGSLAMARLAALQSELKLAAPLPDPIAASQNSLDSLRALREKAAGMEGGEVVSALLDARETRLSIDASRTARYLGKPERALDLLDRAQQKKQGNRSNFANPPSFLVELARAYAEIGQYAPAVEIMFSMSNEFPSSRLVYECLKRLYASKTGGEAPPR